MIKSTAVNSVNIVSVHRKCLLSMGLHSLQSQQTLTTPHRPGRNAVTPICLISGDAHLTAFIAASNRLHEGWGMCAGAECEMIVVV